MKLKRTVAIIVGTVLCMASLSGCSQTILSYSEELAKMSKWEAASSEAKGKISMEVQGGKNDINFTSIGYESGNKSYAKIDFTTLDNSSNVKIPSMEVYFDNGVSYINKNYYEEIYSNNGLEVPSALKELKADYIGVDTGMDIMKIETLMNEPGGMLELAKNIFGDNDIDLPYVKNGREYTMNLNTNEAVDLASKAIKAVSNNLENLNNAFKLELTDSDILQIKNQINGEEFTKNLEVIKQYLEGSQINCKEVFGDDKYTSDLGENLIIKDLGNISLSATSIKTKEEAKDVIVPANSVKLTQEELQTILTGDNQNQIVQPSAYFKEEVAVKDFIKPAI